MEIGDTIKYKDNQEKLRTGVIHGIRKIDDAKGRSHVLSYLIDTGKDNDVNTIITEEGEDNIEVRQPELIDVRAEDIEEDV